MKRALILLFILSACQMFVCQAQRDGSRQALTGEDRERWLTEYRNFKHQYMVRELQLTPQQQEGFFQAYDAMEDELNNLSDDLRQLETRINEQTDASDVELEAAARALYEQKSREGEIEMRYFEQFRTLLQPRQLLKLKNTERRFTQEMVRRHGRMRSEDRRDR